MSETRADFIAALKNIDLDRGWGFGQGDPEFWKFQDKLLVRGGKLLDLGAGTGRSCTFFAVSGMNVTAYDNSPLNADALRDLSRQGKLPITIVEDDFRTADLGQSVYDTVIMDSTLVHSGSKKEAVSLLDKAFTALKPGGCIYVRTGGKEDDSYLEFQNDNGFGAENLSEDVFTISCGCSGEERDEPILFLNQTDLLQYCLLKGMKIIHSQCMPEFGKMNVMYGENWQIPGFQWKNNGAITIIAQKM